MDANIGYMLCESVVDTPQSTIVDNQDDRPTIESIIQDVNIRNRNGRFYEDHEMFPELKSARMNELIESGNMLGEAGHPTSKDIARQQTIDPTNTSHKFLKIWTEGNNIKAYVRGTPNARGREFSNFILDGTKPSFSLRALGTLKNTSRGAEVKNIKIITWDWVVYPSHKKAYMQKVVKLKESGIVSESSNLILNENTKNGLIIPITNDKVIECIKHESANVNSVLESFDKLYDDITLLENGKQVRLCDRLGHVYVVNLETYVQNEIMNYCYTKF